MKKFIFFFLLSLSLQLKPYTVDEFFKMVEAETFSEIDAKNITINLAGIFYNFYPFEEIAQNPPQPYFNSTYFKKVDMIQNFQNVIDYAIEGPIPKYELFRNILLKVHELNDLHISMGLNSTYIDFYYALPLHLNIKMENGNPVVYTELISEEYRGLFRESLIEKIEKNLNSPVIEINKESPFKYIEESCDNFMNVKNPHGSFSVNYLIGNNSLKKFSACPISYEKLKNFNLVYKNGESIATEYIIFDKTTKKETKNTASTHLFQMRKRIILKIIKANILIISLF